MANYTKPNKPDHEDKPEDWLASSLIFANALGSLLQEYEGVVVELKNDMKSICPGVNKVVVFNRGDQIVVDPCSDNFKEGDRVIIKDEDLN